nr:MAG TPA: hypothetical protein [Caudoviricetes sp.]
MIGEKSSAIYIKVDFLPKFLNFIVHINILLLK